MRNLKRTWLAGVLLLIPAAHGDGGISEDWPRHYIRLDPALALSDPGEVVVAIIDTGIDPQHSKLKLALWTNPGETGKDSKGRDRETNGLDDDGNGFVDDVHGWDFVRASGQLSDNHGHGTHIAGIIHSVAPSSRLMILRYYDSQIAAGDTITKTVSAIHYALRMGAKIINYSGGGAASSTAEFEALSAAERKGVLVVAAAGNEGLNSDLQRYYPADYDLNNILSVTAHDHSRRILATSNFGPQTVDLSAPGEGIFSTLPAEKYGQLTGTSQATAFATGVAALVWNHHRELRSPQAVIKHLLVTGAYESRMGGKTKSGVRLDAYRAMGVAQEGAGGLGHQFILKSFRQIAFQNLVAKSLNRAPSSPTEPLPLAEELIQLLSRRSGTRDLDPGARP